MLGILLRIYSTYDWNKEKKSESAEGNLCMAFPKHIWKLEVASAYIHCIADIYAKSLFPGEIGNHRSLCSPRDLNPILLKTNIWNFVNCGFFVKKHFFYAYISAIQCSIQQHTWPKVLSLLVKVCDSCAQNKLRNWRVLGNSSKI